MAKGVKPVQLIRQVLFPSFQIDKYSDSRHIVAHFSSAYVTLLDLNALFQLVNLLDTGDTASTNKLA